MKKAELMAEWDVVLAGLRGVLSVVEKAEMDDQQRARLVVASRALLEIIVSHMAGLAKKMSR